MTQDDSQGWYTTERTFSKVSLYSFSAALGSRNTIWADFLRMPAKNKKGYEPYCAGLMGLYVAWIPCFLLTLVSALGA